jgi:hypothetical protein
MKRRAFLQLFGAGAAAFALDPERLLWVPGQKSIFLPPKQIEVGHVVYYDGGQLKLMTSDAYWSGQRVAGVVNGFDGWTPRLSHRGAAFVKASGAGVNLQGGWANASGYPVIKSERFVLGNV